MPRLQYTGKQFVLTITQDNITKMSWKKGMELYVGKAPDEDRLYIELMKVKK